MLTFVSATRLTRSEFEASSPLARSLRVLGQLTPLRLQLAAQNTRPLADVYNAAIQASSGDEILVFVHDDVAIDDWMTGARLPEALSMFDVVGVAGNRRRQPGQETWYLQPSRMVNGKRCEGSLDIDWLSGAVLHGPQTPSTAQQASSPTAQDPGLITVYGPAPAAVQLLDGMFLAARGALLKSRGVAFDPQLGFHLYDLDFCRSAQKAGLKLGTWPLALTHASGGASARSQAWTASCALYQRKWQDPAVL
ncbi:hypothetical protein C5F52_08680 [Limnohabitans sp. TS-CS-82]|uniref:glycosyltransferase n=1 Tax=Limnohabitans sp. TS-CS-82 TaxID=2094193 RepID=UPI000CF257AE|nr:glycosyltransferase [Limnohabitans sp. TS-CS-82]PQA83510.1 hypothetical protein C5F52_08680 [Limnohabitans sp. TS-CS-82]